MGPGQTGQLVDDGPYRFIRHPLYLGDIVASAGFALGTGNQWASFIVVVLIGLELYRARREEAIVAATIDAYADCRSRTWSVIPGLRLGSSSARAADLVDQATQPLLPRSPR